MQTRHNLEISSIMFNYDNYKEKSVIGKYVNRNKISEFLNKIRSNDRYELKIIGKSYEGRIIDLIKIGNGKTKVLFWSQMHGDESTSTRAILDLINFFEANDDTNSLRERILENISLYIIPMLNPDGAEIFTRRNAQQIDINRDAIAQQSPEGKLLYEIKNEVKPDFAFNLHDQSSGYSAGINYKSSTISLLSPPFNYNADINDTRKKAMQLIVSLYDELSQIIPGHIARYSDEFEPRAFGDNFTKDGIPTILIEAGGWASDPDREFVRKLFFNSLIKSLRAISENSLSNYDENNYFNIPENKELLFDLILRNVNVKKNNSVHKIDIAVKREPFLDSTENKVYYKGIIADIGDLSTFYGYDEIDVSNLFLHHPKVEQTNKLGLIDLLKNGVLFKKELSKSDFTEIPINFYSKTQPNTELQVDGFANFYLTTNNEIKFAIINGYLIDLTKPLNFEGNGLNFH
ncbi:MAG: M14 family zinc carboxypeptidase [Melioribacteraceae bacterium]|nr:MAG: M14 family zinc carboxypeptidase [Melioribacteraceae bacterium]